MFQTAELGLSVPKKEYKQRALELRQNLLELQHRLRMDGSFPVLLDFAGVRGAGKGGSANLLNEWMDARWIHTQAFNEADVRERRRPYFWRFWMNLPPKGQIGIHLSGRYSQPLLGFVYGKISRDEFLHMLESINQFEKALADDGAMMFKFWMHISKDVQKRRLESLENDPLRSWRMSSLDWQHWEMYDRFIEAAELTITHTNTGHAPWEIIEGEDSNYRSLRVGELLHQSLERHLTRTEIQKQYRKALNKELAVVETENGSSSLTPLPRTIMDEMDLSLALNKQDYKRELVAAQARLANLQHKAMQQGTTLMLVFEGPDAAGKGGAIRRVTHALDARYYKVHPFAAPTDVENQFHYLWRFWRCVPRSGRVTIFDRSWYGRVLVERIEGFASEDEWRRAYAEINTFEEQLLEGGIVLLKFWMHIDKDEQLARFESRKVTPHKQWKLCDEDWRNRERWDDYALAAHEMIQHTSVKNSPWILVENKDKAYGRIKVLHAICDALEKVVDD